MSVDVVQSSQDLKILAEWVQQTTKSIYNRRAQATWRTQENALFCVDICEEIVTWGLGIPMLENMRRTADQLLKRLFTHTHGFLKAIVAKCSEEERTLLTELETEAQSLMEELNAITKRTLSASASAV
jgi:hypothetical protein